MRWSAHGGVRLLIFLVVYDLVGQSLKQPPFLSRLLDLGFP